VEISRGEGGAAQHYTLDHQPLKDFRGLAVGHLLLLHDVTMRKQAEAQLLELQWTQATLQEREHLAQELHDSLSQSLSFVNLQAQAAQLYLQGGEGEAALASLARLAEVSRDLQNEMRELIGDLLSISSPSQGLCGVLRQSVARFEHQTGLAVVLEIPDTNAECVATALPATVAVQLLRIVQEALANVRRHAGRPAHILVRLTTDDGQLCLRIADNGAGFDPAQPASPGKHYGLQVMRQRTARIGGEIAVQSAPGAGTCVDARVPLRQTLDATGAGRSLS
jgi:two-component system nitrate/nitrite sensor histidine kinase NarX